MLATRLLRAQHRAIESIFKRLEVRGAEREPLIRELADSLVAHLVIEQELFYPAVAELEPSLIAESYEEHALIELSLKRLLELQPQAPLFLARLKAIENLLEFHDDEEEHRLFPRVERKLGVEWLKETGLALEVRYEFARAAGYRSLVPAGFALTSADTAQEKKNGPSLQRKLAAPHSRPVRPH